MEVDQRRVRSYGENFGERVELNRRVRNKAFVCFFCSLSDPDRLSAEGSRYVGGEEACRASLLVEILQVGRIGKETVISA